MPSGYEICVVAGGTLLANLAPDCEANHIVSAAVGDRTIDIVDSDVSGIPIRHEIGYRLAVRATRAGGNSAWASDGTIVTPATAPDAPISANAVRGATVDTVDVRWVAATEGATPTGYEICVSPVPATGLSSCTAGRIGSAAADVTTYTATRSDFPSGDIRDTIPQLVAVRAVAGVGDAIKSDWRIATPNPLPVRTTPPPPVVTLPSLSIAPSKATFTEGTDANVSFTVTSDTVAPSGGLPVTVTLTANSFVTAISQTATILAGVTTATVNFPIVNDETDETDATVTATITANAAYTIGTATATAMIADDDEVVVLPENRPDDFTITTAQTDIEPGDTVTSNAITVAGLNDDTDTVAASVSVGAISINNAAATTSGMVSNDDTVTVTVTAGACGETVTARVNLGGTTADFVVTTRACRTDATLSTLAFSGVTLSPAFAAGTTERNFTAEVISTVATTTITATATDTTTPATVTITGATNNVVALNPAANTVTITVTAESGMTQTYTVTITRSIPGRPNAFVFDAPSGVIQPGDTVTSNAITVDGLDDDTVMVTASVTDGMISINNGAPTASGMVGNDDTVTVTVTAGACGQLVTARVDLGGTEGDFTVTTRACANDSSLARLEIISSTPPGSVTLDPRFTAGNTGYTAVLSDDPEVQAMSFTIEFDVGDTTSMVRPTVTVSGATNGVVTIADTNRVTIVVRAESGRTTTYTITIGESEIAEAVVESLAPVTTAITAQISSAVSGRIETALSGNVGGVINFGGQSFTGDKQTAMANFLNSNVETDLKNPAHQQRIRHAIKRRRARR